MSPNQLKMNDPRVPIRIHASFGGKPSNKDSGAETLKISKESSVQDVPLITTHVKIYLLHTGEDPGDSSEIYSTIYFAPDQQSNKNVVVANNHDFSDQNGGFGMLINDYSTTSFIVPMRFRASAYEEHSTTTGDRYFVDRTIDWARSPCEWRNGQEWSWEQQNSSDGNYKGYAWWQCTPGAVCS